MENIWDKYAVSKKIKNPVFYVSLASILGILAALLTFLYNGFVLPSIEILLIALSIGLLEMVGLFLYMKAISLDEVSRVIPLYGLIPLFVFVFATIFLNETFAISQYIGIAMLILGAVMINIRKGFRLKFGAAIVFAISSVVVYSLLRIIIKYLSNSLDPLTIFAYSQIAIAILGFIILMIKRKDFLHLLHEHRNLIKYPVVTYLLSVLGFIFSIMAFSTGPATLVSSMENLQELFVLGYATLLSIFMPRILKEEIKGSIVALKLISIIIILAGSYFIIM